MLIHRQCKVNDKIGNVLFNKLYIVTASIIKIKARSYKSINHAFKQIFLLSKSVKSPFEKKRHLEIIESTDKIAAKK